jgi:tRNA dimethylallyltransferase
MVDPISLGKVAQDMLTPDPAIRSDSTIPRKVICEVCTSDPAQPVMIDEGHQEMLHKQSRGHRKRMQKRNRQIGRPIEPSAIPEFETEGGQDDMHHPDTTRVWGGGLPSRLS